MNVLLPQTVQCPYCGESIDVLIDCSLPSQSYIEDCQVCCRPITFCVAVDETGEPEVSVAHEDQ